MRRRFLIQVIQHYWRRFNNCLHARILTVEDSERILLKAANTILIQLIFHACEVLNQRVPIGGTRFGRP